MNHNQLSLTEAEPTALHFPLEPIDLATMLRDIRAEGKIIRPF